MATRPTITATILVALLLIPILSAPGSAATVPGSDFQCTTSDWMLEESLALHDLNKRRLARREKSAVAALSAGKSSAAGAAQSKPKVRKEGSVAVIDDDGTIILDENPFDFQKKGVKYTVKKKKNFKVTKTGGGIDGNFGDQVTLGDDDSVEITMPFKVKFYGKKYKKVWINSDGNLTFGAPDNASTSRDLQRMIIGAPRISPFFADLNPATAGAGNGVFLRFAGKKMIVTWFNVPEFGKNTTNTFQLVVFAKGTIQVKFQQMAAEQGIVGVAPGGGSGIQLLDYSKELPKTTKSVAVVERFVDGKQTDFAGLARVFFDHYADEYDELVMFTDFPAALGDTKTTGITIAWRQSIQNKVKGIGRSVFDASGSFGSTKGGLEGFINMGFVDKYNKNLHKATQLGGIFSAMDILIHEVGHRWQAFAQFKDANGQTSDDLMGRGGRGHWSFDMDSDASFVEGNDIQHNGGRNFVTLSTRPQFSKLDLYLMGLLKASQVDSFFYVDNASIPAATQPEWDVTITGDRVDLSINQLIAAMGKRKPAVKDSQKDFKVAFVILGLEGSKVKKASIDRVNEFAQQLEKTFKKEVGGRADIDAKLVEK